MRDIFNFLVRFLTLNDQNMIPEVGLFALAVWGVILIATVTSIFTQPFSRGAKTGWIAVVFIVPLAGVAVYAVYCLTRQDFSFLRVFGQNKRGMKKLAESK